MSRGTSIRAVRVDNKLWADVGKIATKRGETRADIMRAALERYAKRHATGPSKRK
jgi:predicted transcriptional regulator